MRSIRELVFLLLDQVDDITHPYVGASDFHPCRAEQQGNERWDEEVKCAGLVGAVVGRVIS